MDLNINLSEARELAGKAVDEAKSFLASENGRKIRHQVANGLMIAAPIVFMTPVVRRTRLAKLVELGGGAAMLSRVAEMIRDWEPNGEADPA